MNGETLDWAKHEDEIKDLILNQKKTMDEVIEHMEQKHSFSAT